MAYVGARVVCRLGTEVKRARGWGATALEEKARRGRNGECGSPASHAGAAGRHQADPALLCRGWAMPGYPGRSGPPVRARRPGDRPSPLTPPVELFDFRMAADGAATATSWRAARRPRADSLLRRSGPFRPSGPSSCCARSVTRCPRRSRAGWFIATSNRRTFSSAGTGRSTTS